MCISKEVHHTVCLHVSNRTKKCWKAKLSAILKLLFSCEASIKARYLYKLCPDCRQEFATFKVSEGAAVEICIGYRTRNNHHGQIKPRSLLFPSESVPSPDASASPPGADDFDSLYTSFPPLWLTDFYEERSPSVCTSLSDSQTHSAGAADVKPESRLKPSGMERQPLVTAAEKCETYLTTLEDIGSNHLILPSLGSPARHSMPSPRGRTGNMNDFPIIF
jgi:hypothetical protein